MSQKWRVRGKGIELDGVNKRMQFIRGAVNPIIKEKTRMLLEQPIVMHPNILTLSCTNELTCIFLLQINVMCKYFVDNGAASNKENMDPVETNDWLHRNDSYQTNNSVDENMYT
jgi:hypothetical protein